MYKMGTGDFFLLQFMGKEDEKPISMMIDCGAIYGDEEKMTPYINNMITETNGEIDYLVITHEHDDHVSGFEKCEELFKNSFKSNEVWFAWTEDDSDPRVKEWKTEYGKKKKALSLISNKLKEATNTSLFSEIYGYGSNKSKRIEERKKFVKNLDQYLGLNDNIPLGVKKKYAGGLEGMNLVKDKSFTKCKKMKYLSAGDIIQNIEGLDNIKIYVLAPSHKWKDAKNVHGKEGEAYKHNKELEFVKGLSSLPFANTDTEYKDHLPFEEEYLDKGKYSLNKNEQEELKANNKLSNQKSNYYSSRNKYRRIDYDWLFGSANLALRITRGINNLSLVLAIEFTDTGRVLLFPGDAEIGSWVSWHDINWKEIEGPQSTTTTENILRNTVFYKVAHHLSNYGTSKTKGLNLMTHPDLVSFATLDYDVILSGWRNTMPNRALLKELINKTKGRLVVMNPNDLYLDKDKKRPLEKELMAKRKEMSKSEKKQFDKDYTPHALYEEIVIHNK